VDRGDDPVSPPTDAPSADGTSVPAPPVPLPSPPQASGPPSPGGSTPPAEPAASPAEPRSWSWHVLHLSSWLLLVLLPIQVISTWVLHDPGHMGVAWYVDRWHSGWWRLFDGLFSVVALFSGGLGLDGLVGRSATRPSARAVISAAIGIVLGVIGVLALSTILSFNLT
jgi:succinate dehydrogenase hydrophobic anchor subunit